MTKSNDILLLAGPTASGKTALALDIAAEFGATIINADSMQIYRELKIITARPTPEEEAQAPHSLYGCLSGREACSVAHWLDLALSEIQLCWESGRLPLLVGGTGLYLKALVEGLSPIPAVDDGVRQEASSLFDDLGGAAFRLHLADLDPESAARLPDGDRQRLIRAYEVVRGTGRSLSQWQKDYPPQSPLPGVRFTRLLLEPPREVLYARCDRRFDAMLAQGGLQEVAALAALDLDPDLPIMKAVGVPALLGLWRGDLSEAEARAAAQRATRQYAKRQTTWFRHQMKAEQVARHPNIPQVRDDLLTYLGARLHGSPNG
ncbi:tRNA (adenosine(37)-N6)-dimethylallyltransferase MiaA [Magnetospira thiophila]